MKQFGRQWQLDILNDKETLIINNLRVAFEIDKTINEKPNPAKISVWNLNRNHLNAILSGQFDKLVLSVGYQALRTIYSGDILKARVGRQDLDFVLELECSDGYKAYSMARSQLTLKAGADDKTILTELQKTMPTVQTGSIDVPNKRQLPRGKVMSGDTRSILNKLAKNNQADWSIQDGNLVFLPKDKVVNQQAVLLSQETGMINAPVHTDDGLEITCLLNPDLQIGGLVRVQSILDFFNGDYKIVKLAHSGDGLGGDWLSKMTVINGKFQPVEKS